MLDEISFRPLWDRDLTKAEVGDLSRPLQRLRNDTSLRRKVDFHKGLAKNPELLRQSQFEVKWNPAQLRKHHDPARGFWAWHNKLIDNEITGRNRKVMAEWRDALATIKSVLEKFEGITETEDAEEQTANKALKRQNADLIARVVSLERELELLRMNRR
ncbi:hypothetical protein ACDA55_02430 [Rhizobium ruizarguesonis]